MKEEDFVEKSRKQAQKWKKFKECQKFHMKMNICAIKAVGTREKALARVKKTMEHEKMPLARQKNVSTAFSFGHITNRR